MLAYYNLQEKLQEVKKWYDGYLFNDFEIYNPWSIINYVYDRDRQDYAVCAAILVEFFFQQHHP